MKRIIMKVVLLACIFSVFLSLHNVSALTSLAKPADKTADSAPNFTLANVDGRTVSLEEHRGKGVVLFFFTTWCPYCVRSISSLLKEEARFQKEGIKLLLIDVGESNRKVRSFMERRKLSLDVLLDEKHQTAKEYGVIGVPTFILISKEGSVVYDGNDLPHNYKQLLQ